MKQLTQPFWTDFRKMPFLQQIILQLGHRPIGERQTNIRGTFPGDLAQKIKLMLSELGWTTFRVRGTLEPAKANPIEFFDPAIGGLFGTAKTPCRCQYTQFIINQCNQEIPLCKPDRQFTIMQFRIQQPFFATTKATEFDSFRHLRTPC